MPRAPRLTAVTCAEMPDLDHEWSVLEAVLEADGWKVSVRAWDDPGVAWESFDVALVRVAAWGYIHRPEMFLRWAEITSTATNLINPAPALAWNQDKVYLQDLAGEGLPVMDTVWVRPGEAWSAPDGEFVVKPSRSAGGFETARYGPADRGRADAHVRRLHDAGQTVMIQPYAAELEQWGEVSAVFIAGQPTHAVRKQPLLAPGVGVVDRLWEQERLELTTPTTEQAQLASAAFESASQKVGPLAYARVDILPGLNGSPLVGEVELIDPSLFFDLVPSTAALLAKALGRWRRH